MSPTAQRTKECLNMFFLPRANPNITEPLTLNVGLPCSFLSCQRSGAHTKRCGTPGSEDSPSHAVSPKQRCDDVITFNLATTSCGSKQPQKRFQSDIHSCHTECKYIANILDLITLLVNFRPVMIRHFCFEASTNTY